MVNATLEAVDQDISTGWALYRLLELEVTVTVSPADYESRKITAKMGTENAPLKVALQLYPGDGPVPDNALQLQDVADQAQKLMVALETAIEETIKAKQQEKGW